MRGYGMRLCLAWLCLTAVDCGGRVDEISATSGGTASLITGGNKSGPTGGVAPRGTSGGIELPLGVGGKATSGNADQDWYRYRSCGDGVLDSGEQCDDSNKLDGDGCTAQCRLEDPDPCGHGLCPAVARCGDGVMGVGELCDDGNTVDGDGCAGDCASVDGDYVCPVVGRLCWLTTEFQSRCGNALVETELGEACDEGELNGQSGHCSADCDRIASCGNGTVEPWSGEQCDNGLNDGAYGDCGPNCHWAEYCGDAVRNGPEECDFGSQNSVTFAAPYASCLNNCKLSPHCGDGLVQSNYEDCDNGTSRWDVGDYCMPTCRYLLP